MDCRTRDSARRELYIVEGDSAMGAVKSSRDSEYQAIMPIRGKILNCLKADYARIFKSDVIVDLIKVMGCGVELGGKHNKELATFNLDNLRFNKIVICTDADVDGYQIRTLVLTMLYRLTPTLINKGYVYIAESPLYEITTKDRTYFAYTEPEKAAFLEKIGDKKYTIQRSKGLGENDPEMMWLTTMNPESRRLIKVMPTDVVQTAQVFDILLGDNLAGRKEHIAQHGAEYLDRSGRVLISRTIPCQSLPPAGGRWRVYEPDEGAGGSNAPQKPETRPLDSMRKHNGKKIDQENLKAGAPAAGRRR